MTVHTTWKRAVGAAAAVTLALAVAACGSNGGGGSTTTADGQSSLVWNMWSGSTAEVEAWNHLGEMVTAAHPDIQLEFQTSSFNDYWTKLAAQASGGDTGCILGVQSLRARSIAPLLGAVERTVTEHHAIVDALGRGDAALAAAQMTVHIDGVARWLRRTTGS